jgi:hypothetical protein
MSDGSGGPCARPSAQQAAKAANELQERYRDAFETRGGHLQVSAGKATNIRTFTKSFGLYAEVEWETSRVYDHVHVELARRYLFSRRWHIVRSLVEARDSINAKLTEWLKDGSNP